MSLFISNDVRPDSNRFQVLVNGSFEGASFASLHGAIEAIQARDSSNSFQILDAKLRRYTPATSKPENPTRA
jgi:hypothetical protein